MTIKEYLDNRNVKDIHYKEFILSELNCNIKNKEFGEMPYLFEFSHFLYNTDKPGLGLIKTNELLGIDNGSKLAIGLVEGDDVITLDLNDGSVAVWLVQNGDGEEINVTRTFKDFLDLLI